MFSPQTHYSFSSGCANYPGLITAKYMLLKAAHWILYIGAIIMFQLRKVPLPYR